MPVFINEVVFKGEIAGNGDGRAAGAGTRPVQTVDPAKREALIAEVTRAVLDEIERRLARMDER